MLKNKAVSPTGLKEMFKTPKAKSLKAKSPQAVSPKAKSPRAKSPKTATPRAKSPKTATPRPKSPKAATPKTKSPAGTPMSAETPHSLFSDLPDTPSGPGEMAVSPLNNSTPVASPRLSGMKRLFAQSKLTKSPESPLGIKDMMKVRNYSIIFRKYLIKDALTCKSNGFYCF